MLEMLKTRKEQLQAQGKKGFTLMEMLIVIAIIAILIAIAIPLFTSQLSAARAAADESNARALYAQLQADYMLDDIQAGVPTTISADDSITYRDTTYKFSNQASGTIDVSGVPVVTINSGDVHETFGTAASNADGGTTPTQP